MSEDAISPTPKKNPASVRAGSKLATMKKEQEERDVSSKSKTIISPSKIKISPKKEPLASPSYEKKFTPKTETTVKTSPKKPEVSKVHVYLLNCIVSCHGKDY